MIQLEKKEIEFSQLFEITPDLVCVASKEGFFKKVNQSVIKKLGFTEVELFARPIASFIHPDDLERTSYTRKKLLEGEILLNFHNRYISKSGSVIWLEWTSVYFAESELVFAIAKDITSRKLQELEVAANYQKFKNLASHFKNSIEKDRKFLAYELHEELAQLASVVKMELAMIPLVVADLPEAARIKIEQASANTHKLIKGLQKISFAISPALLHDFGLTATLQWYSQEFTRVNGIPCSFTSAYDEESLTTEIKTDFFRICQEALTNVMCHAAPCSVEIYIFESGNTITLCISDNGKGFELEKLVMSGGLKGIRERAASINGILNIETKVGEGTKIIVQIEKTEKI
ncbi:MAG: PAS domain S-box protein [Gloeobacteraceae cyanobacterium ES-bin-316]|nr:PAS domain S-box protein [Ferruginibacter sp.]